MLDIHTHILPGLDDGATTMTEAITMARIAVADGITHVFATPHHRGYRPLPRPEVALRVLELQQALRAARVPLAVLPGHEVLLCDELTDDWARGLAGPLGDSDYVLTEPRCQRFDARAESRLFQLLDWGYVPILAHPERFPAIQDDWRVVEPFVERGGLIQITAASLIASGRATETAEALLRHGLVHFLASDAHDTLVRAPRLAAACARAAEIVGVARARHLVTAPVTMLEDGRKIA